MLKKKDDRKVSLAFVVNINKGAARLAGGLIFIISLFAGYEALSRNLFGMPTKWSLNISQFLLLYAVFLGSGYCFLRGGHIRIEIVTARIKGASHRVLMATGYVIAAVYVAVLGWKGYEVLSKAYKHHWLTLTTIQVPAVYVYFAIPLGCFLMLLALVVIITNSLRDKESAADGK